MYNYVKKVKEISNEYINIMIVQKRLIKKEIIYYNLKNKEVIFS